MNPDYSEEELRRLCRERGLEFIDAWRCYVPKPVIDMVPHSLALEVPCLPLAGTDRTVKVVVCDPDDVETVDKLRFILDREIELAYATRAALANAIERHYG
jgi:type IV pilus assembly protein PilB